MMTNSHRKLRIRIAATLLELVLSMAAVSILLCGMASAVYLAHQAASPGATPSAAIDGSLVAADMADKLKFATRILSAQATSVQFERKRGNVTEEITYAWSGIGGDPLTRTLDDGDPFDIADNVHHFQLTYVPSPGASANLFTNPGAEDGINNWSGYLCDIEASNTIFRSGSRSLRAFNRSNNTAGPRQFVGQEIESGTSYQVEAWLRTSTGSQNPRISFHLMTTSGLLAPINVDTSAINTSWSKVTAVLTPTWSGELRWAYLKISTTAASPLPDLYCDDLSMTESGTGTPVVLDRIGIELQLGTNTNARAAVSARLLHRPLLWQP